MTHSLLRLYQHPRLSLRLWGHRLLLWCGALAVAGAAMAFSQASLLGNRLFTEAVRYLPVSALLITPLGFVAVLWLTRKVFVGAEGSGIPQTIAALKIPELAERRSVLSLRVAVGKILLTALSLCAGASVGREGPTVQVGASIMLWLGRWSRLPLAGKENTLIIAGAAAGISAAFNTPLAGIVFAIEELSRSFESKTSGTVLTAVIVAGIASMAVLGNYSYFGHTQATLTLGEAWRPVLVCGIGGGLLGGAFARILITFGRGLPGRAGQLIAAHPLRNAACCGVGLALLGLASGGTVYGTGYEEAKGLIEGSRVLPGDFGLLKLAATVLSYLSGIPGGIFAPSLAVGAGLGADAAPFMPMVPAGSVVILGMIAYFTGVVQAPITAVVIVMEMTDNQTLLIPLMATALLAYAASRLVCPTALYRALAETFLQKSARHAERPEG